MVSKGLPAIHPGEFLTETLEELGFSQAAFARVIGVSPMRISHVIKGRASGDGRTGPVVRTGL